MLNFHKLCSKKYLVKQVKYLDTHLVGSVLYLLYLKAWIVNFKVATARDNQVINIDFFSIGDWNASANNFSERIFQIHIKHITQIIYWLKHTSIKMCIESVALFMSQLSTK